MTVLTRILTGKQVVAENIQRLAELAASDALRANKTPRVNIAPDEVPAPPSLNDAIRAAAKRADDDFVAAEVNGVPAPPSLNASIMKFLKKGFVR